ncbi:MAG: HypC/HybG/HupF family hydrogenase formation chaperone [Synechococcus sp.]|nr:HypC/HybG/HupF family hydrogenase formation chaperone [Synechococcus sp.]
MCLAVPGRIIAIHQQDPTPAGSGQDPLWRLAEVDFGGVRQQVSLACLSEARVGDQVLVHVGVAIARVDGDEPLC